MAALGHRSFRLFALVYEPYQPFYVLNGCRKEELLSGLRQAAQPQLTKANLIAQLREERLYLVPSAPCHGKLRRLTELPDMLAHILVPVDLQRALRRRCARWFREQFRHCDGLALNTKPCEPLLIPE